MGDAALMNQGDSQAHPHIQGQQLFAPGRQGDHAESRGINVALPGSRKGDAFDAINLPANSKQRADVCALIPLCRVCCVRCRVGCGFDLSRGFDRCRGFDGCRFTDHRNADDSLKGFSTKQVQRLAPRQDNGLFGNGSKLPSIGHDRAKQTAGGHEFNSGRRTKPVVALFYGAARQTKFDCLGRLWTKGRPCE